MVRIFGQTIPAVLTAGAETLTSFDVTGIVEQSVTSGANQMYSVIGIVAPIIAGVSVVIVIVKFGQKWIKRLGNA